MSRIELSPNSAGSGNFTIASPNSNTNQTLTLPDDSGELAILTELTQVQAEDDTSTVFGQVSGQRLAQAVAANVAPVDTSSVLSAMAGASAGAIGSVAFLRSSVSSDAAFGSTLAGSNLTPAGIASSGSALSTRASSSGSTQSGTWRCLGFSDWVNLDTDLDGFTLWLRIS